VCVCVCVCTRGGMVWVWCVWWYARERVAR
jgi:hypothetical protein